MMKVDSLYRYELPGNFVLPKGVSEIGKLPPAAKEHFDGLVAAGIIKVLDAKKAADPDSLQKPESPKPATAPKPEPLLIPGSVQSMYVEGRVVIDEPPPTDVVDVSTKKRRAKTE